MLDLPRGDPRAELKNAPPRCPIWRNPNCQTIVTHLLSLRRSSPPKDESRYNCTETWAPPPHATNHFLSLNLASLFDPYRHTPPPLPFNYDFALPSLRPGLKEPFPDSADNGSMTKFSYAPAEPVRATNEIRVSPGTATS